jgi:hypothetical protein
MAAPALKPAKRHVNLSLREDLYGVAQGHAKAAGLSVSAFIERYLSSLARLGNLPDPDLGLDPGLAALRGVLGGTGAPLSKAEARMAKHQARLGRDRR